MRAVGWYLYICVLRIVSASFYFLFLVVLFLFICLFRCIYECFSLFRCVTQNSNYYPNRVNVIHGWKALCIYHFLVNSKCLLSPSFSCWLLPSLCSLLLFWCCFVRIVGRCKNPIHIEFYWMKWNRDDFNVLRI